MDFIILNNLRISVSNISHYLPTDRKASFTKQMFFEIEIHLKTQDILKIDGFKTKNERDIFLVQMDGVLLSHFKRK